MRVMMRRSGPERARAQTARAMKTRNRGVAADGNSMSASQRSDLRRHRVHRRRSHRSQTRRRHHPAQMRQPLRHLHQVHRIAMRSPRGRTESGDRSPSPVRKAIRARASKRRGRPKLKKRNIRGYICRRSRRRAPTMVSLTSLCSISGPMRSVTGTG